MLTLARLNMIFAANDWSLGFRIVLLMMQVLLLSQLLSCTLSNGSRRLPTRQLVSIVVSGGVLGGADR